MEWLVKIFTDTESVAHIMLIYGLVISLGLALGRIKFFGISLGVTFVLFAGILMGHLFSIFMPESPFACPANVLTFVQDFGLILFVYCIGLQVGPGFFESFKKGGVTMNMLALSIVALNVLCCIGLFYAVFYDADASAATNSSNLAMMVGVLCGAITNTPGLGAANEAVSQVFTENAPNIANGYACAYPLGVVGIILSMIVIRYICRINLQEETDQIDREQAANPHIIPHRMTLVVSNRALNGRTIFQMRQFLGRDFVCSRILQNGHVSIPNRNTVLNEGDKLYITCAQDDAEALIAFIGPEEQVKWEEQDVPVVSKHILVTQDSVNGKTLGSFHFSSVHGVNVTRVRRGDLNLFADSNLRIQVGDRLVVVGPEDAIDRVALKLGNSVKKLDHPNLSIIFIGIVIGILFGSLPFSFGMPTPLKLGLAGGPLIIAILLGRFGYKLKLVTYTTTSANLMLREIGLVLFLASVGIKAGANFVDTVVEGAGLHYVWCGFIITLLPLLVVGLIARLKYKINYFTLMGLIAGSTTDPPALAFANQTAGNDAPSVGYSTVYPLVMFMRILTAQLIILLLCAV